MRVLVCGGRDFSDRDRLAAILGAVHAEQPFSTLIHGAAPGADMLAGEWAISRGIPVAPFPADWKGQGAPRGPFATSGCSMRGARTWLSPCPEDEELRTWSPRLTRPEYLSKLSRRSAVNSSAGLGLDP
jgi:hypothetical protein